MRFQDILMVAARGGGAASVVFPVYGTPGTAAASTVGINVAYPATVALNQVALMVVETANQAVATPTDFTALTEQGTGTAGGTSATRLQVFWKRCAGTEGGTTVAVADAGEHQTARMYMFTGCITTGDPFDVFSGDTAASDTAVTVPGLTTTVPNCLIVALAGNSTDGGNSYSAHANASLANLTAKDDISGTSGNGGGWSLTTGEKAVAGVVSATTMTQAVASVQVRICIALKPPA